MNRLAHLQATLPENLHAAGKGVEYVIGDYGSTDAVSDWIATLPRDWTTRLRCIRDGTPRYFHMAKAKNLAHHAATGDIVCNLDADGFITPGFVAYLRETFAAGPDSVVRLMGRPSAHGRIALLRHHFEEIGGYDERFEGWGWDDDEFVHRVCSRRHLTLVHCPEAGYARCLEHSDDERMENYSPTVRAMGKERVATKNAALINCRADQWRRGLLIPRVLNFVTLNGDKHVSPATFCAERWNPGWEVRVWNDQELAALTGPAPESLDGESLRAWFSVRLLFSEGGVVLHPHVRCAQSLETHFRNHTATVLPGNDAAGPMFAAAGAYRKHSLFWDAGRQPEVFGAGNLPAAFRQVAARHRWHELPRQVVQDGGWSH